MVKKFLFDQNIFKEEDGIPPPDDGPVDTNTGLDASSENAEPVPLPQMFTEEEMEAARRDSFEKGRKDGISQTKTEREEHAVKMLGDISKQINELTINTQNMKGAYSDKALLLAVTMFDQILPDLQNKFGFEELKARVSDILQAHGSKNTLQIHVHPDMTEPFGTYIAELEKMSGGAPCVLMPDDKLEPYACHVKWQDGGGLYDQSVFIQDVKQAVLELLPEGCDTEIEGNEDKTENLGDENPPENAYNDQSNSEEMPENGDDV